MVWESEASVYAGQEIHEPSDADLFDAFAISTSSSGGSASLEAEYTYEGDDETRSLESVHVRAQMLGYEGLSSVTHGVATYRLLFRVSGMPVRMELRGTCTLEVRASVESYLGVRIHDQPGNNIFDLVTRHHDTTSGNNCTNGWERVIEQLNPGVYQPHIANYGFRDVEYDFTFTFAPVEDEG